MNCRQCTGIHPDTNLKGFCSNETDLGISKSCSIKEVCSKVYCNNLGTFRNCGPLAIKSKRAFSITVEGDDNSLCIMVWIICCESYRV